MGQSLMSQGSPPYLSSVTDEHLGLRIGWLQFGLRSAGMHPTIQQVILHSYLHGMVQAQLIYKIGWYGSQKFTYTLANNIQSVIHCTSFVIHFIWQVIQFFWQVY